MPLCEELNSIDKDQWCQMATMSLHDKSAFFNP